MPKPPVRKPKKKVLRVLQGRRSTYVDYKDTALLRKFISDRGKIRARRVTGNCTQHQRDDRHGGQEHPRDGAAALHLDRPLREGTDMMKLILTQEVTGLGAPGDIVEVKDGYGRNYLVPRGVAIRWTKGAEKQVAPIKRAREVREIRDARARQGGQGPARGAVKVTLAARAGDGGRLFGSVTAGRHRRRGQGRRRSRRRQAPHRDRHADQDRRRAPGHACGCTPRSPPSVTVEVVAA